jgi:hypothetical protein
MIITYFLKESVILDILDKDEMNNVLERNCVMSYVFTGAGFPMHRDLIWSIVRPL